jgi:hypothetical protein
MEKQSTNLIAEIWGLLQSSHFLAGLSAVLALLLIVLFVVGFIQGRSVSLWPPKIGARPISASGKGLLASGLTPSSVILEGLITSSLETVCRAVSLPHTPGSARIRVFIFKKEEDSLVCRYYWSQDPTREQVGKLRFNISSETAKTVAVVRALLDQRVCRTPVTHLPKPLLNVSGDVDDNLSFVLAAPIFDETGAVWGTVDFDTARDAGMAMLSTEESSAVIHQLAKHLQIVFKLES